MTDLYKELTDLIVQELCETEEIVPGWFVKETAKDIIEQLSENEKEELLKHPDYIDHHEGFGMWIRNTYIHGKDLPMLFPIMADDLSAIIFEEVIKELTGETGEASEAAEQAE